MSYTSDLTNLHTWFHKEARILPWRQTISSNSKLRDPYRVWISEIMLQQTQVVTVIPYFEKWMQKWPTLQSLAGAKQEDVLAAWAGLGYYSRARNIQATAIHIVSEFKGIFPKERKKIENLKGIGPYTAGAILSLAFNQAESILDGNLIRIFSRYYTLMGDPKSTANQKTLWEFAELWVKSFPEKSQVTNESLMELGAKICSPKKPDCNLCPISENCKALQEGKVEYWPRPTPKQEKIIWKGVAVLVEKEGKTLLVKGKEQTFLKSTWCLPLLHLPKQFNANSSIKHNITKYNIQLSILKFSLSELKDLCKENNLELPNTQTWVESQTWQAHVTSSLAIKLDKLIKSPFQQELL